MKVKKYFCGISLFSPSVSTLNSLHIPHMITATQSRSTPGIVGEFFFLLHQICSVFAEVQIIIL